MINELRDQLILAGLGTRTHEEAANEALGVLRNVLRAEAKSHWKEVCSGETDVPFGQHLMLQFSELMLETTMGGARER